MRMPMRTALLSLGAVVLAASGCIDSIEPPVADPGSEIRIRGSYFGSSQGVGYVSFLTGDTEVTVSSVDSWSDGEIRVTLPPEVGSCKVRVYLDPILVGPRFTDSVYLQVRAPDLPSSPYGYEVPVEADSPWPSFRHDRRNTGRSPIAAAYGGGVPWSFRTGKGIFSTPIISGDGTVYIGSADHNFYALNPDGTEKWRFETGEMIDSAATITRYDPAAGYSKVVFLSGDGFIYCLRTDDVPQPEDRLLWTLDATAAPGPGYNNWWEGNVVMGFDGTLYAGNTNWNYYAFTQEGRIKWTHTTGANAWSAAGFADDGTIFWGSLDVGVYGVGPDGTSLWWTPTLGFVASSAAVGSDGTVYIGSFDSSLYALRPSTGSVRWQFPTGDHVYCSPALAADEWGNTSVIYFGSADGTVYALTPGGNLLWTYDTGDTIRSSPAIGPAPAGEDRNIVYVGCGNGKLYALNGDDGTRRWSFDTTPDDPVLKDRNDLNGSPALGPEGVYIGGEHGFVWHLPYDYCLYNADPRCETDPGEEFPDDGIDVYYVTPGGNTEQEDPETVSSSAVLTARLVVREAGETVDAAACTTPLLCPSEELTVDVSPPVPFRSEPSADGHYVYIIPEGFFEPGTEYQVSLEGAYLTDGFRFGNLVLGGTKSGTFSDVLGFRAEQPTSESIPLEVSADEVTAFEWKRLAAPLPPMLPSLNQIGFDSYHWIVGTQKITPPDADHEGKLLMWAIGALSDAQGNIVPDPNTDFRFPLSGRYMNDFFILANQSFAMEVTEVPVHFDLFQLRGGLDPDLRVRPGASAYAEADCLSIPTFGPLMALAGLCNNAFGKLLAYGTYITQPYDPQGTANKRPEGISVSSIEYTPPQRPDPGLLRATFSLEPGTAYPVSEHLAAVILVDTQEVKAVGMDYHANLELEADGEGNLAAVSLRIPAGTQIPAGSTALIILDVFPLYEEALAE